MRTFFQFFQVKYSEPDRLEISIDEHKQYEKSTSNQNNFVEDEDDLSYADSKRRSHYTESEVRLWNHSNDSGQEQSKQQKDTEEKLINWRSKKNKLCP